MYLTTTRPDILNVVSILSRFMNCASEMHLKVAKRVIRYVKGTSNFGIKFKRTEKFKLTCFSNSDWGGSIDDMKSTSGYCFNFGSKCFLMELEKTRYSYLVYSISWICCCCRAINQVL